MRILSVLLFLLLCCSAVCAAEGEAGPFEALDGENAGIGYEHRLFDESRVHRVDIRIDPLDWDDLVTYPQRKTRYHAALEIDGEPFQDVSLAAKGNSSLYDVASVEGARRFSFNVSFGKFTDGQTYHGLNKLKLHNLFNDATYMKDHICYDMFRSMGVQAPLTSYAWITVNGEDLGLYMAVEDVGKSFRKRVFSGRGALYKPESALLTPENDVFNDILENRAQTTDYGMGSELSYRGEALEQYGDIFQHAQTKVDEEDQRRVVAALRGLSRGENLDEFLDTAEILCYFAVHNFVLNFDSYTGPMLHNYFLYELDGRLSMLPWDYNEGFGSYWNDFFKDDDEDATEIVNQGIDTPLVGATEDQRPMWRWIPADEAYLAQYHAAMEAFLSMYFDSGAFRRRMNETFKLLRPYVAQDPTAFYTVEEYSVACRELGRFCMCRVESVRRQLDGELAAATADQSPADQVDASDVEIME